MGPCRHSPPAGRCLRACLALVVVTLGVGTARADDDDAAEAAVERGAVAPPAALFDRVADDFGGRILKLELEHEDDDRGWIYEVKLLQADGRVIKVEYDAVTLEVLEVAGRRDHAGDTDDESGTAAEGAQGGHGAAGNADSPGRGRSSADTAD